MDGRHLDVRRWPSSKQEEQISEGDNRGKSQLEVQAITKSMFANKAKILSLLNVA